MPKRELRFLRKSWTARTKDGSLSVQVEYTVLVNDEGCEILTQ